MDIQKDFLDCGAKCDHQVSQFGVAQQLRRAVPPAVGPKCRPADLGTLQMLYREPVERPYIRLKEGTADRRLPDIQLRSVHHLLLHPLIRRVDQTHVPHYPGGGAGLEEGGLGAAVEAAVDGGAPAEDPTANVADAVEGGKGLSRGVGNATAGVGKDLEETVFSGCLGVVLVVSAALQEKGRRSLLRR